MEEVESGDNRPQSAKLKEPFSNLKSEPVPMTIKLDGKYTNVFTGEVMTGDNDITLAPGEYLVLTRK